MSRPRTIPSGIGLRRPAGTRCPLAGDPGTINRLVVGDQLFTSYYSFAGLSASEMNRLNEYVGRCCTALRGGHQVTDIAVVYPVESVWPHYDPSPHHATRQPTAMRIEQAYLGALDSLFSTGRAPTIVDAQALAEATIDGAELVHGQLRWRVVVLPGVETLPAEAWHTLQTFHRAGGVIVSLALPPANSATEFPAAAVQTIAQEWFGEAAGPVLRVGRAGGTTAFHPACIESTARPARPPPGTGHPRPVRWAVAGHASADRWP